MTEIELVENIKKVIMRYMDDQKLQTPHFSPQEIPGELHGHLADLMFRDKVTNQTLVSFLVGLLTQRERSDQEILVLLEDILKSLQGINLAALPEQE